jgi:probable rRNA maturation factor
VAAGVRLAVERGPHRGFSRAEVERRMGAMLACLQLKKKEVSILLTDDDQIRHLNKVHRGKDRATDVLAFALREGDFVSRAGSLLGDVVVSVPTARRQAAAAGRDVLSEITMLLAHGLLHLLGWDHDTAAKDRAMRRETDRLVRAAGREAPARQRQHQRKERRQA